jgi:hypothetical protein
MSARILAMRHFIWRAILFERGVSAQTTTPEDIDED